MKAIVMEINDGKAVIMRCDGTFKTVNDKGYTVGQKITVREIEWTRYAAAAACVLLAIGGTVYGTVIRKPDCSRDKISYSVSASAADKAGKADREDEGKPRTASEQPEGKEAVPAVKGDAPQQKIDTVLPEAPEQEPREETEKSDIPDEDTKKAPAQKTAVNTPAAPAVSPQAEAPVQEQAQENESEGGSSVSMPAPKKPKNPTPETTETASAEGEDKLAAVQNYTEYFGGTVDENAEKLQGATAEEIIRSIEENKSAANNTEGSKTQTESSEGSKTSSEGESSSSESTEQALESSPETQSSSGSSSNESQSSSGIQSKETANSTGEASGN